MRAKYQNESFARCSQSAASFGAGVTLAFLVAALTPHNVALAEGCNIPLFAAARAFSAGGLPSSVVVGDFNKDGVSDFAVANSDTTNTVQIFLGNGNGTFQFPIIYTVSSFPQSIAVTDLNGDTNSDLVIDTGGQLYALFGNSNGTFQAASHITGTSGFAFAFGKFGPDTNMDMVVGNNGNIFVYVRQGNGNGTFQGDEPYNVSTGFADSPASVTVGDMNADGKSDIVVGNVGTSSAHVVVLLGKGDGTFFDPVSTAASLNNSCLALGDFNHDGTNDVATANYDAGTLTIFFGNGNGTLRSNAVYSVGANPQSIAVGNFNCDTNPDLIVGAGTNIAVLVGNGDGTFQPAVRYLGLERALAIADFNGDGKMDLVAAANGGSGKVGVALGNGNGTFQIAPFYAAGKQPESAAIADFNGDGKGDMVVANMGTNFVSVFLNNGDGTFQPAVNYTTARLPQSVAVGDFNGDGTNDIAVTTAVSTNMVSILLGNGNGTFKTAINYGTFGGGPLVLRDFNKDNKLDLIANSSSGLQVQLGNGDGTFHSAGGFTGLVGGGPGSLAIADFNGDGTNDLAFATGGTNVTILLGFTNGTWRPAANNYFAGTNCQSVVAGDFNGDGTNDLVAANFGTPSLPDGTVSFLYGNGNGTFRAPVHYFAGAHPIYVTAADFNGDGKLDLAVRYLNGFGVSVMLGNGDGTFQPPFGFDALNNSSMGALAFGDLNGDGKPDLALPNLATSISVLLNTCTAIGPGLSIIRGSSSFMISWPLSAGSFILESTMNFNPPNWQPVTEPLTTNNGQVQITPPLNLPGRFFRLHQQ